MLEKYLLIHDKYGIHNLHGISSLLASVSNLAMTIK